MSFKMSGILAFKGVAARCKPILLEPLDHVEIITPDHYLGDVMGNLSGRRGQILGSDTSQGGMTTVKAHVPQGELHLYATDLSSLTHGHATYRRRFHGYEQMPQEAAQKVIAESARSRGSDAEEA
ncbi:MAG: hypothetical protein ABIZ91_08890 [Gemmatimonadaceae bacterium]